VAHEAYNGRHPKVRRALILGLQDHHIRTGEWLPCPRCGLPMAPDPLLRGQGLDLGHSQAWMKEQGLPGDRLEHMACNRSFGDGSRTPSDWTSVNW
jgi:hypothetical protein